MYSKSIFGFHKAYARVLAIKRRGSDSVTRTHDVVIIKDNSSDIVSIVKMACAEVKKKLRINQFLTPVYHQVTPYGHIVIVELPGGREREVGNPDEVGRRRR